MIRRLLLLLVCVAAFAGEENDWPAVLVVDDFENGLGRWANEDTGTLTTVPDDRGGKAMLWTAADDGIGRLVYQNLTRDKIDFSQYDLLTFRIRMEGKKAWNVNPIIQQYPAVYGYRGLYNSVDTLMPFGRWFTYSQDLRRWENAWPDTFNATAQEFAFEVAQLAGGGNTRVYLDDITLLKNPLGVEKSYPGRHATLADGTQVTHFAVAMKNSGKAPLTVEFELLEGSLTKFTAELPPPRPLLPGEGGEVLVRVSAPAAALADAPPWYGETARVAVKVRELPGLELHTELTAGSLPANVTHPCILANPELVAGWQQQWAAPDTRKQMDRLFPMMVSRGEEALGYVPEYPPLGHPGRTTCPVDNGRLVEIEVPTQPFRRYQCPECGNSFSGPLFDAGMQGYTGKHTANAYRAQDLAFAYAITGRREFAVAARRLMIPYIELYEQLPIMAPAPGSPVYSHTSGAVRIGGSYMVEQRWLTALGVAIDFIRPAGVLGDDELTGLAERVVAPSAHLMMDHKVGAMNLQWMIESAALFAGLAVEHTNVVARATYDWHGVRNLIDVGYLDDGNWWENPSYQNVANGCAFPVLITVLHTGLLPWEPKFDRIFSAAYRTYGPDGRGPTLGTGGPGSYSYTNNALHALGGMLDNPQLAWVPYHQPIWRANSGGGQPYTIYLWAATWQSTPKIPEDRTVSPIPDETTILPDYGGIAMRVPGARNYCYLQFGRELIHGHRDKLSINAYAKGDWFVRNGRGGYGDDFHDYLETIASSTSIMLHGQNPDWDTGELLFHQSLDGIELASAREVGAWKDVEHERSVVQTPGPVIVVDRCLAATEKTYEWLYQAALTKLSLDTEGLPDAGVARFGEAAMYGSMTPTVRYPAVGAAHLTRKDGSGLAIAFLPRGELFGFRALKKKWDGLLWRQTGANVGFAAVYWPHTKDETGEVAVSAVPVTRAGAPVDLTVGQAVRAVTPEGTWVVLVNYTGEALAAGPAHGTARITVARE